MNQKPLALTAQDFMETRTGNYHARWPLDRDTTERLDRVRQSDPYAQSKFKDRYSLLRIALHGVAFLSVVGLFLISLVIIVEWWRTN